jgi:hypothetical protein
MTKIPDISFEIDGEFISLKQDLGGEIHYVQLHRMHLQHIAGLLGIPILDASAAAIKRRFEVVRDGLISLADTRYYREDIIDNCASSLEFYTELDDLCKLANEFLADLTPQPVKKAEIGKENE